MMMAWSVIHGGPGGNFLSKTLYNALAYGIENVSADPRDIPSSTMQEKMALVSLYEKRLQYLADRKVEESPLDQIPLFLEKQKRKR